MSSNDQEEIIALKTNMVGIIAQVIPVYSSA